MLANMMPQGERSMRARRSAAYEAAPRQANTVKQLLTKRCRQYGRGWMSENISGTPAGRSVFLLTSLFIGPTTIPKLATPGS